MIVRKLKIAAMVPNSAPPAIVQAISNGVQVKDAVCLKERAIDRKRSCNERRNASPFKSLPSDNSSQALD